jgi:hypothetical protein
MQAGNEHMSKHSAPGLWDLLDAFFAELRETAEQLTIVERWYQARARIFGLNAPDNDQHRQSNPRI